MLSLLKKKKKEKLPARLRGNTCLNCEIPLSGEENFCPDCGQRNNTNPLSFKLVVDEFLDNFISIDSRVWNTTLPLIFKPGKVAYEFVSGKRKNFVNPFRTYLTVSLIFFLIYGLLGKISEWRGDSESFKPNIITKASTFDIDSLSTKEKDSILKATFVEVQKEIPIKIDSTISTNSFNIEDGIIAMDSATNASIDNNPFSRKIKAFYKHYDDYKEDNVTQALDTLGYKNSFWNRFYYDKTQKTHDMINGDIDEFNQTIFSNLSIAIFLFLPIFALFLKFIYLRRKYTYMEHMVFVFYTQSVFFLLLLLFILLKSITNISSDLQIPIFLLAFAIYLLLAMKVFYKQGWFKTIVKYMMANFSFIMIASIGMVLLTFISFIFY